MKEVDPYAQAGVDVKEGDSFSAFAGKICRNSFGNSPFIEVKDFSGHYRGPRAFRLRDGLPKNWYLDLAPDGIGTKVILIDASFNHRYAFQDALEMCFGDIERWGGVGAVFVNVLDTATLGKNRDDATPEQRRTNLAFREMMTGLGELAEMRRIVLYRGETAELPGCVSSDNPHATTVFNVAGMALGVYREDRMILGDKLSPGQLVVALREYSLGSNGYSLARNALASYYGADYYARPAATEAIRALARPCTSYGMFLTRLNGWWGDFYLPVNLITHITGGGIPSKFGGDILFPRELSAELTDLWEPPEIMRQCVEWKNVTDRKAYKTLNGGQRVLVVIDRRYRNIFLEAAESQGIEAKVCGKIVKSTEPYLLIKSKFRGVDVEFTPKNMDD